LLRMAEEGPEGPIYLLNLLKYKDHAEYEDRRETSLTGQEAYAIYGMGVFRLMQDFGGYVGIAAPVTDLMVGEVGELWDSVAIACYPSRAKMLALFQSREFNELTVHRTAGLAGQLNIEMAGALGTWLAE
ncbi:MAG: DUF1330 domain-containing protein, partial [Pseudomonadota bacterium]